MDFGLVKNKLVGRIKELDMVHHLQQICTFMDDCLSDWKEYINTQREKYYHLNHYTTKQIVILRHEIAKICGDGEGDPSRLVYPMLNCIHRDSNLIHLKHALHATFEGLTDRVALETEAFLQQKKVEPMEKDIEKAADLQFLGKLKDEGFCTSLARNCMKHFKYDELEAG